MQITQLGTQSLELIEEQIGEALKSGDRPTKSAVEEKLEGIVLPKVELESVSAEGAIDYLRSQSREHDPEEDPRRKGVNFIMSGVFDQRNQPLVTLSLENTSLKTAVEAVAKQAGFVADYSNGWGVLLTPKGK